MFTAGTIGWILLSLFTAYIGRDTKIGFWGVFFCSMLFSPLIVFVVIVLLSRLTRRER